MKRLFCASMILLCVSLLGTRLPAQQVGPERGSLVLVGGALKDPAILHRFMRLAGGLDAPIVVIPTAGAGSDYGPYWEGLAPFKAIGATNLSVLHTRDRNQADTEEFAAPIGQARGVWFSGGRQWRLADSYLDTRVHTALWDLLGRGGVIGGSSAGATIQGSYLARGDTQTNTIMMGDHEEGLGFLKNVAVDQHLLKQNRHFDLLEVIQAHPSLLGIGLDEDTAIVVQNNTFEVIGQSYVVIYDHGRTLDSGGRFYFLAPGDLYDLGTREAFRARVEQQSLDRVQASPWPSGN